MNLGVIGDAVAASRWKYSCHSWLCCRNEALTDMMAAKLPCIRSL